MLCKSTLGRYSTIHKYINLTMRCYSVHQNADGRDLQEYLDSLDAVEVFVNLAGMFTYWFKFEDKDKQEMQHDGIKIDTMVYMLDNLVKIPVKFLPQSMHGNQAEAMAARAPPENDERTKWIQIKVRPQVSTLKEKQELPTWKELDLFTRVKKWEDVPRGYVSPDPWLPSKLRASVPSTRKSIIWRNSVISALRHYAMKKRNLLKNQRKWRIPLRLRLREEKSPVLKLGMRQHHNSCGTCMIKNCLKILNY